MLEGTTGRGFRRLGILRILGVLLVFAPFLGGCTVALEPAYDEKIVSELETLTLETEKLFAAVADGIPPAGHNERIETYAALTARAATIKLYAEARPAPSGRVSGFFANLFTAAAAPETVRLESDGDRTIEASDGERYANATAGFMEDFLRNLKKLADRDRENVQNLSGGLGSYEAAQEAYVAALESYRKAYSDWLTGRGPKPPDLRAPPAPPTEIVSANFVERRRIVIEDILRDALFYERDVLNRNR